MKAILKVIDFNDNDPLTYMPSEEFGIVLNLTLFIGLEGSDSINYFDLFVCSIKYLSKKLWEPQMGKGMMIVDKYDMEVIKSKINECIAKCDTGDWDTTAVNLSRYFDWEFEDYQP